MEVTIGGRTFSYPASPEELTLGQWVEFLRDHGLELDRRSAEIEEMPPGITQAFAAMKLYAERSYAIAGYFAGISIAEAQAAFPLQQVTETYRDHFTKCFISNTDQREIPLNGQIYTLPDPVPTQGSAMTFGEVLDSKAMLQNSQEMGWSKWELIQSICAIFLRPPGEQYREELSYLGGERIQQMAGLTIGAATAVSSWYEELNDYLEQSFTIFQESSGNPGPHIKKHFRSWGWVNFLKSMAKEKVWDIPGSGLNSIQCARQAKAYDVLMYASEEKEHQEAMSADFDLKNPPSRK